MPSELPVPPDPLPAAVWEHLERDPALRPILTRHEPKWRDDHGGDVYFGLIRAITYQQLSGKAAGTIFGRFLDLFNDGYPHPEQLLAIDDTDLRAAGMSRSKAQYLKNVAQFWLDERLLHTDWSEFTDEEILDKLTAIKGVGRWTVEMILMFVLKRHDVLPLGDLVVRRNLITTLGVREEDFKGKALDRELARLAEAWRPYRSWVSRLMWEL